MSQDTPPRTPNRTYDSSWSESASFVGSILAGALIGYLLDLWLGTAPWLVVIGIVLGSYSGFMRMWVYSKKMEEDPRRR